MMRTASWIAALAVASSAAAEEVQGASRWLELHEIKRAVSAAPGGRAAGVTLCILSVYSRDKTATNLRAGPSRDARVIATLPPERREAGANIGPEFQVIAGKGEWFLIRGAHWAGYDLPEKALVLGPAWMAANLVGFSIESARLLREPRDAAELVLTMRSEEGAKPDWGPDNAKVERIHGCSGSYVDVSVTLPDGRKARGWITGLCGNQVTTCGGGHVPSEARAGGLYRTAESCASSGDERECPRPKR